MKKIILASGSPRRQELLSQIGISFEVRTSDADESLQDQSPSEAVDTWQQTIVTSVVN